MDIAREIPGWPGYTITKDGEVTSPRGRKLKVFQRAKTCLYMAVALGTPRANQRIVALHRLLALAFLPNPKGHPCINHIDANPQNNTLENLEWCDHSRNNQHTHDLGRGNVKHGEEAHHAILTEAEVKKIRWMRSHQTISEYSLAKLFGVSRGCVQAICTRKSWKHI